VATSACAPTSSPGFQARRRRCPVRVGDQAKNFNGVYGFAADSVRSLVITRLRSSDRVPVVNNVFLSLRGQRSARCRHHPLRDLVIGVHALMRAGGRQTVPYVADGQGVVPGGNRPSGPSYFARGSQHRFPAQRTSLRRSPSRRSSGCYVASRAAPPSLGFDSATRASVA